MASVKVKFRPSTVANREGTVYYQILQGRKPRQVLTSYHILEDEWDERHSRLLIPSSGERKSELVVIHRLVTQDVERLKRIILRLDSIGLQYDPDDVVEEFRRYSTEYTLFNFMERLVAGFRRNGHIRTSETYKSALNSMRRFLDGRDVILDCINPEMMEAYQSWHQRQGNSLNTISFYNRILRAVYNRAVRNGWIENRNPFIHVYTGVDKTVKRALPLTVIRRIKSLDLSLDPSLDFARDMLILSFMLRGMSFIDMAFLRKSDLVNGYLTYRRRKTGQQLIIKWTKVMQAVLDKYPENESAYLLPIIRHPGVNERSAYRNVGYNINHNLKSVAKLARVSIPLTLYVARHSWASAARTKGVPISVISEGMGHDSESTTRIYLASLDTSVVDRANSLIIKCI